MFMETSAKAGQNVMPLFKKIAQALPGMDDAQNEGAGGATHHSTCSRLTQLSTCRLSRPRTPSRRRVNVNSEAVEPASHEAADPRHATAPNQPLSLVPAAGDVAIHDAARWRCH